MKKLVFKLSVMALAIVFLASCGDREKKQNALFNNGVLVLCEGVYQQNNSTISYYDMDSNLAYPDVFYDKNNRYLGDLANNMIVYGSKLYIAVDNSNMVEVVDVNTGKSLSQIMFKNQTFEGVTVGNPRHLTAYNGKVYVSCYTGHVASIDTTSYGIDKIAKVGKNPEGLVVVNDKLYVCNSGGLDYGVYDTTVSVVNINTMTEESTITVVVNPAKIAADNNGNVYVVSYGNYADVDASFQKINTNTNMVEKEYDLKPTNFCISGNYAYVYGTDWSTYQSFIKVVDLVSDVVIGDFIQDDTEIRLPYGIMVDQSTQDVYISDALDCATNGDVYCFDKNGKKRFSFEVGINPNTIIRVNKK
ncbi:MAG: hypothetical protein J6Y47_04615 [Bacteroidales bacterium]|nr:hypothetical protein [Bacteroidales bacterium]